MKLSVSVQREPLTVDEIRQGIAWSNAVERLIRKGYEVKVSPGAVAGARRGKPKR